MNDDKALSPRRRRRQVFDRFDVPPAIFAAAEHRPLRVVRGGVDAAGHRLRAGRHCLKNRTSYGAASASSTALRLARRSPSVSRRLAAGMGRHHLASSRLATPAERGKFRRFRGQLHTAGMSGGVGNRKPIFSCGSRCGVASTTTMAASPLVRRRVRSRSIWCASSATKCKSKPTPFRSADARRGRSTASA